MGSESEEEPQSQFGSSVRSRTGSAASTVSGVSAAPFNNYISTGNATIDLQYITSCYTAIVKGIAGNQKAWNKLLEDKGGDVRSLQSSYEDITTRFGKSKKVDVGAAEDFLEDADSLVEDRTDITEAVKKKIEVLRQAINNSNNNQAEEKQDSQNLSADSRDPKASSMSWFCKKLNATKNAAKRNPKTTVAASAFAGMVASVGFSLLGTKLYDHIFKTEGYNSVSDFFNNRIWDASSASEGFKTVGGIYGSVAIGVVLLLLWMAWKEHSHAAKQVPERRVARASVTIPVEEEPAETPAAREVSSPQ